MSRPSWRNAQHIDRPELASAQTGFYDTKRGWTGDRPKASASETLVYNDTGATVNAYEMLEVVDVDPTPTANLAGFQAGPVLVGKLPLMWAYQQRFVVTKESIAAGQTGKCFTKGIVPVQIEAISGTPDTARWAQVYTKDRLRLTELRTSSSFPLIYRESGSGTKWGLIDLSYQAQEALVKIRIGSGPVLSTNGYTDWWTASQPFITGQSLVNFEHIPSNRLKINGNSYHFGILSGRVRVTTATASGISFRTRERFLFAVQVLQPTTAVWLPAFERHEPAALVPLADANSIFDFSFVGVFDCRGTDLATGNEWIKLRFRSEYPGSSFQMIVDNLDIRLFPQSIQPVFGPSDPHNPGSVGVLSGSAALGIEAPAMDADFTFTPFLEE